MIVKNKKELDREITFIKGIDHIQNAMVSVTGKTGLDEIT